MPACVRMRTVCAYEYGQVECNRVNPRAPTMDMLVHAARTQPVCSASGGPVQSS